MRTPKPIRQILRHALLLGIALLFLLPLWWVVVMSLRPTGLAPPLSPEWWPASPAWANYGRIFELVPLLRQIGNSLLVSLVAVPLTLLAASWAGYAMASLSEQARGRLVALAVGLMLLPSTALWLTRFLLFKNLGLMDSLWALMVPAIGGTSPFYVLLFFWTFRRIPRELFEAARLEGAGHGRLWARVAMPLASPTIVTVGVLAFSFFWSDWISPLLYLKSQAKYTLPVGLQALEQMDLSYWPLLMAGAVVMLLPVVLVFLLAQRFFWPDGLLLRPWGMGIRQKVEN